MSDDEPDVESTPEELAEDFDLDGFVETMDELNRVMDCHFAFVSGYVAGANDTVDGNLPHSREAFANRVEELFESYYATTYARAETEEDEE